MNSYSNTHLSPRQNLETYRLQAFEKISVQSLIYHKLTEQTSVATHDKDRNIIEFIQKIH